MQEAGELKERVEFQKIVELPRIRVQHIDALASLPLQVASQTFAPDAVRLARGDHCLIARQLNDLAGFSSRSCAHIEYVITGLRTQKQRRDHRRQALKVYKAVFILR